VHKTAIAVTACVALAGGIRPAGAEIQEHWVGGQECVGALATARAAQIIVGVSAQNDDQFVFHTWTCPAHWDGGTSFANSLRADVIYFDRSTAGSLRCEEQVMSLAGSQFFGPSVFSCSAFSGCPTDSEPAFTSATPRRLILSVTHPNISKASWAVTCQVPPRGNGARTGIASLFFQHNSF